MMALAEVNWDAMFSMPNFVLLCVFGFVTIVSVAGTIGSCWQKVRQTERETQLKRDLAARGYSVDEIERIVRAKPGKG